MKYLLSLVFVTMLLAPGFCTLVPAAKASPHQFILKDSFVPSVQQQKVGIDLCHDCLELAHGVIQTLLNEILQVGIMGSCSEICALVQQKTGQAALGAICNILCDIAGVEEFIKILNKADLDTIYYCELVSVCPIKDNGDAKFTQFEVMPKSGPQGDFDISFEYTSINGTGTGQIVLDIDTVDKIPLGQAFLHEIAPAGTFTGTFKLRAEPDPNCDPTQGPCERWEPGTYNVKIAICNGECGSKHPHSKIYDEAQTTFTITSS